MNLFLSVSSSMNAEPNKLIISKRLIISKIADSATELHIGNRRRSDKPFPLTDLIDIVMTELCPATNRISENTTSERFSFAEGPLSKLSYKSCDNLFTAFKYIHIYIYLYAHMGSLAVFSAGLYRPARARCAIQSAAKR